jgi:hypothetical protein
MRDMQTIGVIVVSGMVLYGLAWAAVCISWGIKELWRIWKTPDPPTHAVVVVEAKEAIRTTRS